MDAKEKPSALSALERYQFETQILMDSALGKWFVAICDGKNQPATNVPEETLAMMEQRGLVRKTEFGWRLRPEGREFARTLGLVPGPVRAESNPNASRLATRPKRLRDLRRVWNEFKKSRSEKLRNALMENYLHLVRYNAEQIHVKLPDEVELDDLMSAGIFGLMDAINAFDPGRGMKFETYCAPRIRGAILDELRSMDWVPRLVRSRAHKIETAARSLEAELGRSPTNSEIAHRLKVSIPEFEKMAKDASAVGVVSLSRKWFETDSNKDVREVDVLEEKRGAGIVPEIEWGDLKDLMTKGLSSAERLILILYYFQEMTMKEIALTLDLSESRVSNMHSSILDRLRVQMAARQKKFRVKAAT